MNHTEEEETNLVIMPGCCNVEQGSEVAEAAAVQTQPACVPGTAAPCLQFVDITIGTVYERVVRIQNESELSTTWSVRPQRFPCVRRRTLDKGEWLDSCGNAGLCVECAPASGRLKGHSEVYVHVRILADTWGVYCERVLFEVEGVEPLALCVWAAATGSPLRLALQPAPAAGGCGDNAMPTVRFTQGGRGEERRELRVRNVSRATLRVHTYLVSDREADVAKASNPLPFRLLLRFVDTAPPCRCCSKESDRLSLETSGSDDDGYSERSEDVCTGVVLFLAPDYGQQQYQTYYSVHPPSLELAAGAAGTVLLSRCARARAGGATAVCAVPRDCTAPCAPSATCPAPPATILLEMLPVCTRGVGWSRGCAGTLAVHVRDHACLGELRVSDERLTVRLCAAALPPHVPVRVRKRVQLKNVGAGPLRVTAHCEPPWKLVLPQAPVHEASLTAPSRTQDTTYHLQPRVSVEVCVEMSACAADVVPVQFPYQDKLVLVKHLTFLEDEAILQSVALELELEYNRLLVEPTLLEFGTCVVRDTRKDLFTISHTSRTTSLDVMVDWNGGKEFRLHPLRLQIAPGQRANVYVQYSPRGAGTVEGSARAVVAGAGWCEARVEVRARATHDYAHRSSAHDFDHTDDTTLLPPHHHCNFLT